MNTVIRFKSGETKTIKNSEVIKLKKGKLKLRENTAGMFAVREYNKVHSYEVKRGWRDFLGLS